MGLLAYSSMPSQETSAQELETLKTETKVIRQQLDVCRQQLNACRQEAVVIRQKEREIRREASLIRHEFRQEANLSRQELQQELQQDLRDRMNLVAQQIRQDMSIFRQELRRELQQELRQSMNEIQQQLRQEVNEIRKKVNANEQEVKVLHRRVNGVESSFDETRPKLVQLSLSSDEYMASRNLFFAVFRRDVLGQSTADDCQIIASSDVLPDIADVLVDCHLGSKYLRDNTPTFKLLYGLDPETVLKLSRHDDTIDVLDAHGSALANSPYPLGESGEDLHSEKYRGSPLSLLHAAFVEFVAAMEDTNLPRYFLQDTGTRETAAYWAFWEAHSNWQASPENGKSLKAGLMSC